MLELALPNMHALAVMIMIVIALVLFTRDNIPMETTSLVVLVVLAIGFQLFPYESDGQVIAPSDFFAGFRKPRPDRGIGTDDRRPGPDKHRRAGTGRDVCWPGYGDAARPFHCC